MVGKGDPLRPSNLDSKGFTQYKRMGKGYYEKTAGVGPNAIADGKSWIPLSPAPVRGPPEIQRPAL